MLEQSLPVNSIIGACARLFSGLRADLGNLEDTDFSATCVISDLFREMGIPQTAMREIFTADELVMHDLEDEKANAGCMVLSCQWCGEEAMHLVNVRGKDLLLCESCESKAIEKGK